MINRTLKKITPPIISDLLRKIRKPPSYTPSWHEIQYPPLKGVKIFFDRKGPWQKKIISGSYDDFLWKDISRIDLNGKTVYDIGSHIGFHSLYFSRLIGESGTVYAFEPNPYNIERIEKILEGNENIKNVRLLPLAVGNADEKEIFHMNSDIESGRSSGGFIEEADTIWERSAFESRGFFEKEVDMDTIDNLVKNKKITAPHIMKIDVEGAEGLVLDGAKNTIRTNKPLIYLEVHSMNNMFSVVSFFKDEKYEMSILNTEKDGRTFMKAMPK